MFDFARIAAAHSTGEQALYRQSCLAMPVEAFQRRLAKLAFTSFAGPLTRTRRWWPWPRGEESLTHWCVKTKASREAIPGFQLLFPDVRHVHIVRNGVDTVYSRTRYPSFCHLSFEEQCEAWVGELSFYRTLRQAEGVLLVRHEDLTDKTEETVRSILDFCGLEWASEPLRRVQTEHVHPLDEKTRQVESVPEEIRAREPVWDMWSPEEREIFQRICGPAMEELGYDDPEKLSHP